MSRLYRILVLATGLWMCLVGCDGQPESVPAGPEADTADSAEVDRLRALPYLGYSKQKGDERQGVVLLDRQRSYPGYSLYSNHSLCLAELIDWRGRVVRSWKEERCQRWANCELLPDGDLLVVGVDALESDERQHNLDQRYLLRLSWQGDVVWKRYFPVHHDVELTPGGNLLALAMRYRRIPAVHPTVDVRDHLLSLLTTDGELLEEVSLYDLFDASAASFQLQEVKPRTKRGQEEIDLFHANSVEWMRHRHLEQRDPLFAPGNVLISIRHQDMIAVFDWERKRLVWAWGQGEISGPHDATVLENGHFLLFDNGLGRGWSRVLEIDPITKTIVWEYRAPDPSDFFTASRGSNQRLPNGNTLITNSDNGQVFEVTADGQVVWEFLNTHLNQEGQRATIARTKRYELSFIEDLQRHFGNE